MAFQEVMRQRFEAVASTRHRTFGDRFMSGNQQDPDLICEVFVLSPTDLFDETNSARPPSLAPRSRRLDLSGCPELDLALAEAGADSGRRIILDLEG